jgi:cytochrome c5
MDVVRRGLLLTLIALLGACTIERDMPLPVRADDEAAPAPWREGYLALGRETYERSCASCHDEGLDGAPVIGDRDAWSERSPLWSAVLLEHAKSGYLAMPARGGSPELTDRAVEAAGEYMLSETFPERPGD